MSGSPNDGGWNNGSMPIIRLLFGAVTAPVTMVTGCRWGQPSSDFNGRHTVVCGMMQSLKFATVCVLLLLS